MNWTDLTKPRKKRQSDYPTPAGFTSRYPQPIEACDGVRTLFTADVGRSPSRRRLRFDL